jgi:outer membrane protein
VQFAQVAFAGMRHEELAGYRETIETLNAEQELANAQLNFLANRYNEFVARAALLAAIGDLTVEKIAPDVPAYDAEGDFRKVRNRGRTPLEPIVQALDNIGAAKLRRPLSADLSGADVPPSRAMPPAVSAPNADLARAPLTPITESRVVPAAELPPGYKAPQPGLHPDSASTPRPHD